jgi:Flp pilus assembly protein TadD
VLAERPEHAKARDHLGEVYAMWGQQLANSQNDEQAALRYQEALQYRADDVDVHIRLGMTFARMDRLNESRAEFEAVLRLKPDSQLARQAIDAIVKRKEATGK